METKLYRSTYLSHLDIQHVTVPVEVCRERVRERNINKPENIFSKNYERPKDYEGLKIVEVKNE
jgi:hypothetical protein